MSGDTGLAIAPVDLVFSGEMELDSSVADAWPCVLDYATWQNFPIVEHISGTPGGEGEVVLLKKEMDGYTIGPYFARTLKLDHENHVVVWKVYVDPDQVGIDGLGGAKSVQGNVEFRLYPAAGDRCVFWYDLIYEYLVPHSDPAELAGWKQKQSEDWGGVFKLTHKHLKELVETGVTTPA